MTIDVEVLSETYAILKQYVPQKDRQEAADAVMSVLVDMLGDAELQDLAATDGSLSRALKQYAAEEDDDEEIGDY
jgi:uncharacterized protein YqeY